MLPQNRIDFGIIVNTLVAKCLLHSYFKVMTEGYGTNPKYSKVEKKWVPVITYKWPGITLATWHILFGSQVKNGLPHIPYERNAFETELPFTKAVELECQIVCYDFSLFLLGNSNLHNWMYKEFLCLKYVICMTEREI